MKSLSYEFFLQVAIFTLKNDLELSNDQINRFKEHVDSNLGSIAEKMLEIQEEAKGNISSSKGGQYIEH